MPDHEKAAGLEKPELVVDASDENDSCDEGDSAILANEIAVAAGGVGLLKMLGFMKVVAGFEGASLSAGSQPRHPGQGGASSYRKKLRGSLSFSALRFCSSVASLVKTTSTSSATINHKFRNNLSINRQR